MIAIDLKRPTAHSGGSVPVRLHPDSVSSCMWRLAGSGTAQVLGSVLQSQHIETCAVHSN